MKGFKGRPLTPVDPATKTRIEAYAARCGDWEDRSKTVCVACFRDWWKPKVAPPTAQRCKTCCAHQPIRGYMLKGNGEACPQNLCVLCGSRWDIPRNDLRPVLDVCLRNNVTDGWAPVEPCSRCGATDGTELHHWAPRAIFNDADSWPMSWLCPACHRTWHQAMRLASGHRLDLDQRVGEVPSWWVQV